MPPRHRHLHRHTRLILSPTQLPKQVPHRLLSPPQQPALNHRLPTRRPKLQIRSPLHQHPRNTHVIRAHGSHQRRTPRRLLTLSIYLRPRCKQHANYIIPPMETSQHQRSLSPRIPRLNLHTALHQNPHNAHMSPPGRTPQPPLHILPLHTQRTHHPHYILLPFFRRHHHRRLSPRVPSADIHAHLPEEKFHRRHGTCCSSVVQHRIPVWSGGGGQNGAMRMQ
ncbi:hypothetical protein GRF29_106g1681713 [Pseudopithomyces chartarum]|uniref:Uncharacterized protein n=1 Tax=Pseudopithomyces chartarum TaxID=1892770 RepID=A0AAN6LUP1_9PLEO|nr:hypothetical protein GRF29_106g1681713 [Pseudopithomyces chartarum]